MSDSDFVSNHRVRTFFYGSYMNPDVLRQIDITLDQVEVAWLPNFDITIRPLANLVRSHGDAVYGIVGRLSHADLRRLYQHARDELGGVYLPEAVVAQTTDGGGVPALCYIAPLLKEGQPSRAYVTHILDAAHRYKFPAWYVAQIERFRPRRDAG